MSDLTPYDTGEVLEPKLWVATGNAASLDPAINPHADEKRSRMGKVDFDNEEGNSICQVLVGRAPLGGYHVRIEDYVTGEVTIVEVGI